MGVWGVDLGVRSVYAVRLDSSGGIQHHCLLLKPKKHSRSQELRLLHEWAQETLDGPCWIEEPPLAGTRNLRTFLHLSQVSGVVGSVRDSVFVPVSSWKKGTVGNGAASKDLVSAWLRRVHPDLHGSCAGDQNRIDATCLALYGRVDQG